MVLYVYLCTIKNKSIMAKAIKCELWVGTSTRFFKWGNFDSIAEAKRYIKSCITCYSEIKRLV